MMTTEMANTVQLPAQRAGQSSSKALLVLIAGWLVPGAGHFLLGKWVRGLLLFTSLVLMFSIGLALKGEISSPSTGQLLDILNFAGDLGNGLMYFVARMLGQGASSVLTASADFGTKFIVVAGLLNVIAAVDAHSLATGRKAS